MKRLLPLLFLCVSPLHADRTAERQIINTTILNPACPAQLVAISSDRTNDPRHRIAVELRNERDRRLIAVKVAFSGWDAAWDLHDFATTYAAPLSLRAEKQAQVIWKVVDSGFDQQVTGGLRVTLLKLLYSDGTTWEDDGGKGCSLAIKGLPK